MGIARILVPLNGLPSGESAVEPAADMAQLHGAELHLVIVDGPSRLDPKSNESVAPECAEYHERQMQPMAERLRREKKIPVQTVLLSGVVIPELVRYVAAARCDLVVMATHGRVGWNRAWVGSVADDLMHELRIPVLLFRNRSPGASVPPMPARIMVALDGSAAAETALDAALTLARPGRGTLVLAQVVGSVFAVPPLPVSTGARLPDARATRAALDSAREYLATLAAEVRWREPVAVQTAVELEPAQAPALPRGHTIAKMARDLRVDLVALTTHDRGATRLLVGSLADCVLSDTECALLVCHRSTGDSPARTVGQRAVSAAPS